MVQKHSIHESIIFDNDRILILGNNTSGGISELYLIKDKKFKKYMFDFKS